MLPAALCEILHSLSHHSQGDSSGSIALDIKHGGSHSHLEPFTFLKGYIEKYEPGVRQRSQKLSGILMVGMRKLG